MFYYGLGFYYLKKSLFTGFIVAAARCPNPGDANFPKQGAARKSEKKDPPKVGNGKLSREHGAESMEQRAWSREHGAWSQELIRCPFGFPNPHA